MAYCTKAQVKTYLVMTSTADDDLFDDELIPAAQAIIDATTGRTFEASSNTAKTFDAAGECISDDGLTLYLGEQDLAAINSITNGDGVAISTANVVGLPRRVTPYYALKIKDSAGVVWTYSDDWEDAISISGKWAYSESAPQDIVHATVRLVVALYKQRDNAEDIGQPRMNEFGVTVMPLALPKDVERYLKPYRRLI